MFSRTVPRKNLQLRRKRTTSKQFEVLVEYLQKHYDLEMGIGNDLEARTIRQEMWARLTDKVNRHGPPVRSCAEWQRTWCDYKYNLKRKMSVDLKYARRNEANKRLFFNKTEQAVFRLLGINMKFVIFDECGKIHYKPSAQTVPDPLSSEGLPQLSSEESVADVDTDTESIVINNDFDLATTSTHTQCWDGSSQNLEESVLDIDDKETIVINDDFDSNTTSIHRIDCLNSVHNPLSLNALSQQNSEESEVEICDSKEAIVIDNDNDTTTKLTSVIESVKLLAAKEKVIETADSDISISSILNDTLLAMQTTQLAVLKELKDSNRHKRRSQAIDEQLLQLEQDKHVERKLQNSEENKLANLMIELRRKELQMYD